MYKRIIIYGGVGSGKTSFAKKLSETTKIPVYSTDDIVYNASRMKKLPEKIKNRKLLGISKKDKWIVEGVHMVDWTLPILKKVELIILLNYKKSVMISRILKRHKEGKIKNNPHGKKRSLIKLLYWATTYTPKDYYTRKKYPIRNKGRFIELKNDKEAENFLKDLKKANKIKNSASI